MLRDFVPSKCKHAYRIIIFARKHFNKDDLLYFLLHANNYFMPHLSGNKCQNCQLLKCWQIFDE